MIDKRDTFGFGTKTCAVTPAPESVELGSLLSDVISTRAGKREELFLTMGRYHKAIDCNPSPNTKPKSYYEDTCKTREYIVADLLARLPQTLPLPVRPDDLYSTLVPDSIVRVRDAMNYETTAMQRNMLSMFTFHSKIELMVKPIGIQFWIQTSKPVPSPSDGEYLVIEPSNPYHIVVGEWVEKAHLLQSWMGDAAYAIFGVLDDCSSYKEVASVFPELYDRMFSTKRAYAYNPNHSKVRETIRNMLTPEWRADFERRVTTAVMLPPTTRDNLHAWISE
jgi:hypothetical protein